MRALLTCAGNPGAVDARWPRTWIARFATLDFYVAIDIYINESTRHADLILPPASPLTQHHYDLIFNAFAVRRVARLNSPIFERDENERGDWEIINGLGQAYAQASGKPWRPLPAPRDMIAMGLARGNSGLVIEDLENAEHGLDLGPAASVIAGSPRNRQRPD